MARNSNSTPLVLTLGFGLGLGAGAMLFRSEVPPNPPPAAVKSVPEPARGEIPRDAGSLGALEKTFQRWGGYAVWENDVTEFAAWDPRKRRHSDFVEVRRVDGVFYFRTLSALTRPLIDHGARSVTPLAFTEPQAMRDAFYRANPDYDREAEPLVELPPRPPERFERPRGSAEPPPSLTPGAGR